MNVLSKLLNATVLHDVFYFHPKLNRVNLTQLCFADDLMIFTKGNLSSIVGIQRVLQLFYTFSGLQLNNAKSELYSSGVSRENLLKIQQLT